MVLKKRNLFEFVAGDLATRIFSGDVGPGERLATEFELCEEFGVSRTVIRDALRVLNSKGLIESRPHSGTLVRGIENWNLLDPQMINWALNMGDREGFFTMLMETRSALEPSVVDIAAQRATDAEIAKIDEACRRMETTSAQKQPDLEGFNKADIDFHLAILDATHNLILRQFGALIKVALLASFGLAVEDQEISQESIDAHRAIVDAIKNRDPAAARQNMETIATILQEKVQRRHVGAIG
ncbi:MAG: FadR family transcriptional regulator [Alphaproteobacteria bacterium]|nr:FadR family transcriptional regulator [Alphaproteobacteria bacterium]